MSRSLSATEGTGGTRLETEGLFLREVLERLGRREGVEEDDFRAEATFLARRLGNTDGSLSSWVFLRPPSFAFGFSLTALPLPVL
eukprot:CAMPEP_0118647342 /NCGR_PEP_ID=MMETSP0785-20121206/8552_1 /TAXON_ID=91992 /ORGANISM="Bolidomonas pacifica, Strain CCMP 1866" /LENGTH=84 /DNA_ID=CAMNT_0006539423 /DNA_START=189 /DNA_END=443 /DNA_ORIENTATION=-